MELKRISYPSALFFGVATFVVTMLYGLVLWGFSNSEAYGVAVEMSIPLWDVIKGSLIAGLSYFVVVLILIFLYNMIAKVYPISWDVGSKK